MKWTSDVRGRHWVRAVEMFSAVGLSMMLMARIAGAQTASAESGAPDVKSNAEAYQTFYLTNLTQPSEANDVSTDLRNMFPKARLYYVATEDAISMRGTAEDIALAKKVLADMDRTRKTYRVTYSITEMDGSKPMGTQHVAVIVAAGSKTIVKQGNRVPLVTGAFEAKSSAPNSQVQYVDVGLNIEASLEGNSDGLRLRSKVEQSNVAEEKSGIGAQDPVIRQTMLEGMSTLTQGKPMLLGSLDIPASTRHEEIEVVSELVR
jgi:type II secretory pathway component GspD/PulD (secretin)